MGRQQSRSTSLRGTYARLGEAHARPSNCGARTKRHGGRRAAQSRRGYGHAAGAGAPSTAPAAMKPGHQRGRGSPDQAAGRCPAIVAPRSRAPSRSPRRAIAPIDRVPLPHRGSAIPVGRARRAVQRCTDEPTPPRLRPCPGGAGDRRGDRGPRPRRRGRIEPIGGAHRRDRRGFQDTVARALPSVVLIERTGALGSGMVFDDGGHIVTNAHVVGNARTFTVTTSDGTKYKATLSGAFPQGDLAVIDVQGANLRRRRSPTGRKVEVGELALAIGNPLACGRASPRESSAPPAGPCPRATASRSRR